METPLIGQMISQVAMSILNAFVSDKIDNPYIKAAIAPLIFNFISGIMQGIDPLEMGAEAYQTCPQGVVDPETGEPVTSFPTDKTTYANFYESALMSS